MARKFPIGVKIYLTISETIFLTTELIFLLWFLLFLQRYSQYIRRLYSAVIFIWKWRDISFLFSVLQWTPGLFLIYTYTSTSYAVNAVYYQTLSLKSTNTSKEIKLNYSWRCVHAQNSCKFCSYSAQWRKRKTCWWQQGNGWWALKVSFDLPTTQNSLWLGCYSSWRRTSWAVVFENIEKMKDAMTRVLDIFTSEWLSWGFRKVSGSSQQSLIKSGEIYFEWD